MKLKSASNDRFNIFLTAMFILLLLAIPISWAQYNVEPTKAVGKVVKKYTFWSDDSYNRCVVLEIDGTEQTFYVANNLFASAYKADELYEDFTEGNWYRVDYLGERADFFQVYPNVVDATPTGDPTR